jgi:hypothetical protein
MADETGDDVESNLSNLLEELEAYAKNPAIALSLGARGINATLLLVAVQGLIAYVAGEKIAAAEDFETVAEEIRTRAAPKD